MSQSLAAPTQANTFRRLVARAWDDPDARSTTVGVAGVIIFYLLLWLLGPYILSFEAAPVAARPHAAPRQFNIELAPDTFAKAPPKQPDPLKFVETNPDAPENTPDKTNNFAAQNQQAAQEKPAEKTESDRAATEGKKDFESNQIVDGRLTKPIEHLEAVPDQQPAPPDTVAATPRAEQNPLPGFDKKEGEEKESYGSNIAKLPNNPRPIPEKIEGEKDAPLIEHATAMRRTIDPRKPQPRPQLVTLPQTRPAILADNKFGTANVGLTGIDAKWSNYGGYLKRMVDTIQIQWERILLESRVYPPAGTTVSVKFVLDADGRIARILDVQNDSQNEPAARACVSGIKDRAPYGPWTEDMKAMLGTEQEMTFTFLYQ